MTSAFRHNHESDGGSDHDPGRHLQDVFSLSVIDDALFTGHCPGQSFDRIYGGQLAAQALIAAAKTVRPTALPVMIQTNYLRVGVAGRSLDYEVAVLADGRSVATRSVSGRQEGRQLTQSTVTFQDRASEHCHIGYRPTAPTAPEPSTLPSREDAMRDRFGSQVTPMMLMSSWPVDVRYVDRAPWDAPAEPANRLWMKPRAPLQDDELYHRAALLYAADLHVSEPVLAPGDITWEAIVHSKGVWAATLDYSMWYHRPVRFDDWLLHEQHALAIANSRGHMTGRFWDRRGDLVASVAATVRLIIRK